MNRHLSGATTLACALAALGCAGLFGPLPAINSVYVTPDTCGQWTATIDATGDGDSLAVDQDGTMVRTFNVQGTQTFTANGTASPGSTVQINTSLAGSVTTTPVTMPPMDASLGVTPTDGTFPLDSVAAIDVSLATPCALTNTTLHVAVLDAQAASRTVLWASEPLPMPPGASMRVLVPAQARGLYAIEVTADSGGMPIATTSTKAYWGDANDDMDRDGATHDQDCDDHDPKVGPFMEEASLANRKDDNCDGRVDEGTTAYDDDGDGISEDNGDCDDVDAGRHPGALELADCRDQNCDGVTDEGVTLTKADDAYEPNDTRAHAIDLQTSRQRSFTHTIGSVTRDTSDDEWFKFFSQDGDWDAWGIDVVAAGIPDGSVYDVELYGSGETALQTIRVSAGSHESVMQRGAMFRDDSGDYVVRIHPIKIAQPWCPVSVLLRSY